MAHSHSVPASEYEEYSDGQKKLTYDEWTKELRKEFKKWIAVWKEYSALEKNTIIEEFTSLHIIRSLRWHIWEDADYSYHIRSIKKSLHWCFDTVRKAQLRAEEEIERIMRWKLLEEHAEKYRDFIAVGTNPD